jgi:hypothetical protein
MSPTFMATLRLDSFRPSARTPAPSPAPQRGPTTPSSGNERQPAQPPQTPSNDVTQRNNNTAFNTGIFGPYKDSGTPCRLVRASINRGDLPVLPMSKVNPQMEMCLAWHAKGMCNANCSCKEDHVAYTEDEYEPLKQWCVQHFPTTTN